MEIIDKKSRGANKTAGKPYISFSNDLRRCFINAAGAKAFDIEPGKYLHFVSDIDRVYFFLDDDNCGMKGYENQGGLVYQSSLVLKLLNTRNRVIMPTSKFYIRKSNTKIRESVTIEVMIHKRINGVKHK